MKKARVKGGDESVVSGWQMLLSGSELKTLRGVLFGGCFQTVSASWSHNCVQKRMGWSTENVDLILDPLLKRKWAWVAALSSAPSSMAPHPWPA